MKCMRLSGKYGTKGKDVDNLVELFKKIKNTSGTNDKIELLKAYPQPEELKRFLDYAYNPNHIYGIRANFDFATNGLQSNIPFDLFEKLKITSGRNAKISLIDQYCKPLDKDTAHLVLNAIDKDIGVNINVKLINKAYKNLIPDFRVQLAHKQTKDIFIRVFSKLPYVYLNLKIDGIRAIIHVNTKDEILFFSRDGKELQEFLTKNIKQDILDNFDKFHGLILDGEIYSSKFHKLMTVVNRKTTTAESMLVRESCKFACFDIVDTEHTLEERLLVLNTLPKTNFIHYLKYIKFNPDYKAICEIARQYIEKGHEGIILKNPFAKYELKRTNNMLKFKNKQTEDLEIIGYEAGEKGSKYEHTLGNLILDYKGIKVKCGSGFTDKERDELWKEKESLIGKTAEISFMEVTNKDSLRHPVFEMIRTDK